MFDLFRSRAKVVRYLLGAVLVLVAVSMVVTLIPGFVGSGYGPENVIAEIGGETLTTMEVQANIQQQLRNGSIPRDLAGVYVPIVINQMIADRAIAYQAERMGFEVTEAEVALTIKSLIPQLFQGGQMVDKQVYAQFLSQMNLTIPQFENNVKKQMLLVRLSNIVLEGEVVTDEEIERLYRDENEKIRIDYVSLSPADFRSKVTVSAEEIRAEFDRNRDRYQIGEKRDARIIVVDKDEVAKAIATPEEELRKIYESSPDQYRLPERVRVRHILLKTTDVPEAEIPKVKARAEELLAQLNNGADFAALAKEHSDDPGSASEGGDLGWISRGQTVANFENTAFSLEPGARSGVITTEYGFHIIEVLEKEKAGLRPFEEVKDEIAEERNRELLYTRMQELADQAHAELVQNPLQAEAIANKLGLTVYAVNQVGAADPIPEAASSPDMTDAIRTMDRGGVTDILEMGEDRLGMAVVTELYPARPAELAEVEDQIRETLIAIKAQEMLDAKRKELEELLPTLDGDLGKLARALGVSIESGPEISRTSNVEGVGTAMYMAQAFEQPEGAIVGPIQAMGQTIVCKVVSKTPADMTKLPEERQRLFEQLKQEKARLRRELFADGVLTRLVDEGEVKIYESTVDRLVSAYRS